MKSLLCAVALIAMPATAQANIEIDQSNLVTVPAGSTMAGSSVFYQPSFAIGRFGQMQSITAGKSGLLTSVDLQLYRFSANGPDPIFSISLVDGEPGIAEEPHMVGSRDFHKSDLPLIGDVQAGSVFNVDLSTFNYRVASGQKFSILLSIQPGDTGPTGPTLNFATWAFGYDTDDGVTFTTTLLDYAGGYNAIFEGDGTRLISAADRGFRTYVDTGVPEPASWAMMIFGFAGIGVSVRQRRVRLRFS
jgi:hypothetical protein